MPNRESSTAIGNRFEDRVATLLRLFGYNVERNVLINGNQIDIKAVVALPTHTDILIVECKDYKRPIGIDTVKSFFAIVASTPPDTKGLFVSEQGFTAQAKLFAENTPRLSLFTHSELERKVIDPDHYFKAKVQAYPATEIASMYVDLKCSDSKGELHQSAEDTILEDSKAPDAKLIAILGEYGSGKSTLIGHLDHRLASSYLSSSTNRIPIRIDLGHYTKALNLRQLITDILVNQFGVRNPRYDIFEQLNRQGRLLLLFDGFDEMSSKVDDVVVRENLSEILRLLEGDSKIVLTCRTSFFRNREDELSLLGIEQDEIKDALLEGRSTSSRVYYLEPFDWPQIEELVGKAERYRRSHGKRRIDAEAILRKIGDTYNLEELAQRPFLLDMILMSVPFVANSFRTITAGTLYATYTDKWVHRDAKKGRTLETPERRLYFAEELAYSMYSRSLTSIHWSQIPTWIDEHLGLKDKTKDYYDYDVRSSNFLTRNDSGYYSFAHKSFMEFFMARKVARTVVDHSEFNPLSSIQLGEEVRQFMVDLYGNSLALQLPRLLSLVTLDSDQLKLRSAQIIAQNVLGLFRQLGRVRTIIPLLLYLRTGSDRNFKSWLSHYFTGIFNDPKMTSASAALTTLSAVCLVERGQEVGLSPKALPRGVRLPDALRREIKRIGNINALGSLSKIVEGFRKLGITGSATTAEIAYSLNVDEDRIVEALSSGKK